MGPRAALVSAVGSVLVTAGADDVVRLVTSSRTSGVGGEVSLMTGYSTSSAVGGSTVRVQGGALNAASGAAGGVSL